ncbi:MAG TPA: DUF922 domain-containing protein [Flavisolibacter sp.]|nr:DUF922 domain-containing protein [Flavisolibacter sp.]
MKLFHLFSFTLLLLVFSGKPAPVVTDPAPVTVVNINTTIDRSEDEEIIPWLNHRKLDWADFRSKPETHSDAVASTSTSLGITYKVDKSVWSYSIVCNFSKHRSWGLLKTNYILAHEQAHFDITEIFARKLYQALQEYSFDTKNFKKDIHEIYQKIVQEKEAMQEQYDRETDHSRNRKLQYEWLEKIENILEETAPFANYP